MVRALRSVPAVLAVALLAATSAVLSPGGEPEAKAALGPVQAVALTGADSNPTLDTWDFDSNGYWVISSGNLAGRIPFPAEVVVITSVKVRAYDNTNSGDMCVALYRARPGDATEDNWGSDCTSGTSTTDPQTLSPTVFKRVGKFHTAYPWASFGTQTSSLKLYGAPVFCRVVG